jgi:hypothetical protein
LFIHAFGGQQATKIPGCSDPTQSEMTWGGIQSLYYDDSDDNIGDISKFGRRMVASLAASMLLFPSNIIVSTAIVL